MNRALLPILARLHSLQVVSRLGPDGERIVASRSDPTPITVMLREINETVLARALHFSSESGARLSIEASGRRILRVTATEGLTGAESCLAATALDDALKDDLIKLLQAFAQPRLEIRVKAAPVSQSTIGISIGIPVALIADLLLVELNGLDAELISDMAPSQPVEVSQPVEASQPIPEAAIGGSRIGRFAGLSGSVLMAWLVIGEDEDSAAEGPEEMVDHLRTFLGDEATELAKQLDRISTTAGEPVCLTLGDNLLAGHSLICARIEGAILLGLAEGNSAGALLPAWSAALR